MQNREIVVWQFVRIMVKASEFNEYQEIYEKYESIWQELDLTLSELSETDQEEYSELMLNNTIMLDNLSPEDIQNLVEIAQAVIEDIEEEMAKQPKNTDFINDLAFEINGLELLIDELAD